MNALTLEQLCSVRGGGTPDIECITYLISAGIVVGVAGGATAGLGSAVAMAFVAGFLLNKSPCGKHLT